MSTEIVTIDTVSKWTKDRLRTLKDLRKQLVKTDDVAMLLKGLDPDSFKQFRSKARKLKSVSRTEASFKNRVLKETDRDSKRFTKILEQLQAK
jgi:hypothetical protein